jgi:hypothetical protein
MLAIRRSLVYELICKGEPVPVHIDRSGHRTRALRGRAGCFDPEECSLHRRGEVVRWTTD